MNDKRYYLCTNKLKSLIPLLTNQILTKHINQTFKIIYYDNFSNNTQQRIS